MSQLLDLAITLTPPGEAQSGAIAIIALNCAVLGLNHSGDLVMNPMAEARGLYLCSTSNQKGDLSTLASLHDTSESFDSGPSDKRPVLAHRGRTTCRQEAFLSTKNVLPEHGILAQNPSVQLEKNREANCLSSPRRSA